MKVKTCSACGASMKRNGKNSSGTQRWRCSKCGASTTHSRDTTAENLRLFLGWLFSKKRMVDMPGAGRSFRRKCAPFWKVWPMPSFVDEVHRVIYVDGIHLGRNAVILIACSRDYVLSWYLAKSENSAAWEALMRTIVPPEVVVTDGGSGFAKARKNVWPTTRVQRCTLHAFQQVRRYTTSHPKLQAGIELLNIARNLLRVKTTHEAELWVDSFTEWCSFWSDFLEEKTYKNGTYEYTHERLRKASRSLGSLLREETLFTYLDQQLSASGPLPATNNVIEGAVNAQLRVMLREHRGLSLTRRIKAMFWWCYMHTECPLLPKEILETMPTDSDIDEIYKRVYQSSNDDGAPAFLGDGVVWSEFHFDRPFR